MKTFLRIFYIRIINTLGSMNSDIFADTCRSCNDLVLNCFDGKGYLFFILFAFIIPYVLYQKVADNANLTRRRRKTLGKHVETIITGISSLTLLWLLGNYKSTFGITTSISVIVGLFAFTYFSEPANVNHTFADISSWSPEMYSKVLTTTVIVILVMLYHIKLAMDVSYDFGKVFVGSLLIPIILVYMSYKAVEADKNKNENDFGHILHIHHVHIFYALSFFTRFSTVWSQIAAGLTLGASLHGAAAFGYDTSFEKKKCELFSRVKERGKET